MNRKSDTLGFAETVLGIVIYLIPIVCAFFIIIWAGRAYREGHKLFLDESLDRPGFSHEEIVSITAEEAESSLAVGRILEKQKLISSGLTFAVKAKLSGYDGEFVPGNFKLSSDMKMEEMFETLSRQPGQEQEKPDSGGEAEEGSAESETGSSQKENKDVWGQY